MLFISTVLAWIATIILSIELVIFIYPNLSKESNYKKRTSWIVVAIIYFAAAVAKYVGG